MCNVNKQAGWLCIWLFFLFLSDSFHLVLTLLTLPYFFQIVFLIYNSLALVNRLFSCLSNYIYLIVLTSQSLTLLISLPLLFSLPNFCYLSVLTIFIT